MTEKSKEKTFASMYCEEALLKEIECNLERSGCKTRSEFLNKAARFYLSYLAVAEQGETVFPVFDTALNARIAENNRRLSNAMFRLAVEIAMSNHITAGTNEIDEERLAAIRKLCTKEVKNLSGRYRFEDAVWFQNG